MTVRVRSVSGGVDWAVAVSVIVAGAALAKVVVFLFVRARVKWRQLSWRVRKLIRRERE